jgi:glycosyltransferase involved in cell wall biosynthesis
MQEVLDKYMPDCPVFNANIDNLADRLEELILNPDLRLQLGRRGIEFVKKHLDPIEINEAVIDLYRSL